MIFQKMCNATFICMARASRLKIASRSPSKAGFPPRAAAGAAAGRDWWEDLRGVGDNKHPT